MARLVSWLDERDRRPTVGRPRADPVDRLARQALALDRDDLARLVAKLSAALALAAA